MKYIVVIRVEGKNEAFSFNSEENRKSFIDALPEDVAYITTEEEENENDRR